MERLLIAAFCGFFLFCANAAQAQTMDGGEQSYLGLGIGYYDVFDDESAGDFRAEYRHGKPLFWVVKPWAGAEVTSDATVWAGGGVLADFKLAPNIYLTPSFGAGLYAHGSSERDLDYPIQFRTQIESGYEFTNGHRVGVALSHMSNAGLGDNNPGAETLNVYYQVPIGAAF